MQQMQIREEEMSNNNTIQILGMGCPKCKKLEMNAIKALEQLELNYNVDHITEIQDILKMGVMNTPALALNGKVLSSGKLLTTDEIIKLLNSENK